MLKTSICVFLKLDLKINYLEGCIEGETCIEGVQQHRNHHHIPENVKMNHWLWLCSSIYITFQKVCHCVPLLTLCSIVWCLLTLHSSRCTIGSLQSIPRSPNQTWYSIVFNPPPPTSTMFCQVPDPDADAEVGESDDNSDCGNYSKVPGLLVNLPMMMMMMMMSRVQVLMCTCSSA